MSDFQMPPIKRCQIVDFYKQPGAEPVPAIVVAVYERTLSLVYFDENTYGSTPMGAVRWKGDPDRKPMHEIGVWDYPPPVDVVSPIHKSDAELAPQARPRALNRPTAKVPEEAKV